MPFPSRPRIGIGFAVSLGVLLGCGDGAAGGNAGAERTGQGDIADLAGGDCQAEVDLPPIASGRHVEICTPVTHATRPPSSGTHYATWPKFRVYEKPVPWGFLVHALEHGAVVIAHNCAGDCSPDLASLRALHAGLPSRGCPERLPPLLVTPDPTLDVPFAASAWGATLRARCFDRERFSAFVERRANRGPELIPGDCGAVDLEASGWCPGAAAP